MRTLVWPLSYSRTVVQTLTVILKLHTIWRQLYMMHGLSQMCDGNSALLYPHFSPAYTHLKIMFSPMPKPTQTHLKTMLSSASANYQHKQRHTYVHEDNSLWKLFFPPAWQQHTVTQTNLADDSVFGLGCSGSGGRVKVEMAFEGSASSAAFPAVLLGEANAACSAIWAVRDTVVGNADTSCRGQLQNISCSVLSYWLITVVNRGEKEDTYLTMLWWMLAFKVQKKNKLAPTWTQIMPCCFFQQTFILPVCTINYLYKNRLTSSINGEINNKINKVQPLITLFHTL